jgi:hypothetical protein
MTPLPDHRDFEARAGMDPRQFKEHTAMHLDTNRIYLCTDVTNGAVHLLLPKTLNFEVVELRLDDPDPSRTDAAEFKLLREEMEQHDFDLP